MILQKNLQNLCAVGFVLLLLGLGCSKEEPKPEVNTPRRDKYITAEETRQPDNTETNKMTNTSDKMTNTSDSNKTTVDRTNFHSVLEDSLKKRNLKPGDICNESDPVEKRILSEYGAVFLTTAAPPPACMFKSENDVTNFQKSVSSSVENIGGAKVELQSDAMKALLAAIEEAKAQGLKITPRDGEEASKRDFEGTLRLWKSRFDPGCDHWKKAGKLTDDQINKLKSLPINEQVKEVLELEKKGLYFNTFFNATILSSVAAPGTSQHLSMLAFDAVEFQDTKIRQIMGNHGWFRTVKGDEPHFTYLGVKENDLKNMGLQKADTPKGEFWVPNV
ncbi:MAG: hypothetical protein K1X72_01250 [Pyrinomonadaceae bacterium]|nr:hypothetical protein [Pyrinomonadaceae bacterium]